MAPPKKSGPLPSNKFAWLLVGLILVLALFSVCVETVGIFEDEGIYETTAHSLAEGRGYRIDTLPGSPPNAKYPFLYPAWLAALKIVFPGSGFWKDALLKLSNLPFLLALIWIFFRTLRDQFQWPLPSCQLAASLLGICASVLTFATVMMTELPFTLAVWLLLRELFFLGRSERKTRWWLVFALGVLIYYLRTAGVAILAAVLIFLALRKFRRKALFLLAAWILAALPWILWSKHAASEFSSEEPGLSKLLAYHISYDYHFNALIDTARQEGWIPAARFLGLVLLNNIQNLLKGLGDISFPISLIYAGSLLNPPAILGVFSLIIGTAVLLTATLGYRQSTFQAKAVLGIVFIFHNALFIVWPWPFAVRFLIPVAPILIFFVGENLRRWPLHWHQIRSVLLTLSMFLQMLTSLTLFEGGTLWTRFLFPSDQPYKEALDWMHGHVSKKDVIFSGFDSQWISRELEQPVVGYNTLLGPKSGLEIYFKMGRSSSLFADEFQSGLREWKKITTSRSSRIFIFADASLNQQSWQSLEIQHFRNELDLLWEKEGQPVKIFEFRR
jgi:hypothetical protein